MKLSEVNMIANMPVHIKAKYEYELKQVKFQLLKQILKCAECGGMYWRVGRMKYCSMACSQKTRTRKYFTIGKGSK